MLTRCVVDDEVENDLHPPRIHFLDQLVTIVHRAIWRIDTIVVADVVAHVNCMIESGFSGQSSERLKATNPPWGLA